MQKERNIYMSEERKKDAVRSWLEWLREKELGSCIVSMRDNPVQFVAAIEKKRKMIGLLDAGMEFIIAWVQKEERLEEYQSSNKKLEIHTEEIKKEQELWEIIQVQNFVHEMEKLKANDDVEQLIRLILSSRFSEVLNAIGF